MTQSTTPYLHTYLTFTLLPEVSERVSVGPWPRTLYVWRLSMIVIMLVSAWPSLGQRNASSATNPGDLTTLSPSPSVCLASGDFPKEAH